MGYMPPDRDLAHKVDSAVYPFRQVVYTPIVPDGGEKSARQLMDKAFPQLAAILKAGSDALGVSPERISPFLEYSRPAAPGFNAAKYAASIMPAGAVTLGDTDSEFRDVLKESAREALKDIAKDVAVDVATQAIPVAGTLVKVGLEFFENKDLLKTPEGRAQMAQAAGFAVAAMVPGFNIVAAPIMALKAVIDLKTAKAQMEAQVQMGKEMMKMIEDNLDAALEEARGLSAELSSRGVHLPTEIPAEWIGRLRAHYEALTLADIDDRNSRLKLARAQYIVDNPAAVTSNPWLLEQHFTPLKREMGATVTIQLLLQFARDIHRVRDAVAGRIKPVGSSAKSPEAVAAETQAMVAAMLAKDPLMPIQEAYNLAAAMARGSAAAVTQPEAAADFAQGVAEKVKTNSALLVGGGSVALAVAIKFLPMMLGRR